MSSEGRFRSLVTRTTFHAALLSSLVLATGCAQKPPQAPQSPDADFVFPLPGPGELSRKETPMFDRAWNNILAGRTVEALEVLRKLAATKPARASVDTAIAFAELRATKNDEARAAFSNVLRAKSDYLPALLGAAATERRTGHLDAALALYERAAKLKTDEPATRRVGELRLAIAERSLQEARSLSSQGKNDEALRSLHRALEVAPDLGAARIDLATRLAARGDRTEAIRVLNAAPTLDRDVLFTLANLQREDGNLAGYEATLRRVLEVSPDDPEASEALRTLDSERERLTMPEALRDLASATRVTRAELVALIIVKVPALRNLKGNTPEVASDLGRTWAKDYVIRGISLGVMDVFPNHTFQPAGIIRRGELARAAARVLDLMQWPRGESPGPTDMSPSHLQYASVVRVMEAGLMDRTATGAFEPWRIVTGADVVTVVNSLARLSAQNR